MDFNVKVGYLPAVVPPSAFPDATNTGVPSGTSLLAVPSQATSGSGWSWNGFAVVPTGNGVTISGLDINGQYDSATANRTGCKLQNSKIRGLSSTSDYYVSLASSNQLVNCDVGGLADGVTQTAIAGVFTGGPNNLITACNIHHIGDGLRVDGGTVVSECYIHDLVMQDPSTPGYAHSDGSQSTSTTNTALIRFYHNTVEGGSNQCLFFEHDKGPIEVVFNRLIYVNKNNSSTSNAIGAYEGTSILVQDNVFDNTFKGGSALVCNIPKTTSGNTYADGTAAVL